MYFVLKYAVYDHGIFWIGEDLEEAKKECDIFCNADYDDHHNWVVCKFGLKGDKETLAHNQADHEEVYKAVRKASA